MGKGRLKERCGLESQINFFPFKKSPKTECVLDWRIYGIIYLLKSSTCFEHYPAHLQEVYVVIVYMQPLVSLLSVGDCPVHRLRKNRCTGQSNGESDDTRSCIFPVHRTVTCRE